MKVIVLHTAEALGPPEDPVLGQLETTLQRLGHEAQRLVVDDGIEPLVVRLNNARPDLVFNLAEAYRGLGAHESNVAGLLSLMGLRYTGSGPVGLLLAGDKTLTKKILGFHGIKIPEFATLTRGAVGWADDVAFPLIVKPTYEDGSVGIDATSVVKDVRELLEKVDQMQRDYGETVLVEQFIEGREFYVGVLGNQEPRALPVIELDFSRFPAGRPRVASWDAKWERETAEYGGTTSVFPTDLPEGLVQDMQRVARQAFQALQLHDYGRIDLRVSDNGEIYILEVNPNCYLEKTAEFARAAGRDGFDYDELVARIVDLAAARYAR